MTTPFSDLEAPHVGDLIVCSDVKTNHCMFANHGLAHCSKEPHTITFVKKVGTYSYNFSAGDITYVWTDEFELVKDDEPITDQERKAAAVLPEPDEVRKFFKA